jgi:hypothetical protein
MSWSYFSSSVIRETKSAARTLNGSEVFLYAGVPSADAEVGPTNAPRPPTATAHASPSAKNLRPGLLAPLLCPLAREGAELVFTI